MSQQPETLRENISRNLFHLRRYKAWIQQGRPRQHPVIVSLFHGRHGHVTLRVCPHGKGQIELKELLFDGYYMDTPNILGDELWEYLSSQYPTTRVTHLDTCTTCQQERTPQP